MDANGVAEIKDFSRPGGLTPKQFRIDDDVFSMASSIPFGSLGEIAKLQGIMVGALNSADDADRSIAGITEVFAVFMHPESLARFKERLHSRTEPIGFEHIRDIIPWLLEVYSLRPTAPSSGSSNGSPAGDGSTSSTDGASPVESSGGTSQPTEEPTSSIVTSSSS